MAQQVGICRLCRNVRPLQSSHHLPAGVYKLLRSGSDPRHVVVGSQRAVRVTTQLRTPLLCGECEARFNNNGERWVLTNGLQPSGEFKLQEMLLNSKPKFVGKDGDKMFAADAVDGLEIKKLVYFAMSMFWRGAVVDWSNVKGGMGNKLTLGKRFEEAIRTFLLDETPFPEHAVLHIQVESKERPHPAATIPFGGKTKDQFFQYSFHLPGIVFMLALGQSIPKNLDLLCAVRSPHRLIFLSNRVDQMMERHALSLRDGILKAGGTL